MSVKISVRAKDEKTWQEFKDFVLEKHGKLHTALGEELIEALKFYLEDANKRMHTHNLSDKALKEADKIKREVLKRVEPGGSVPQQMLENIVRQASAVMDKRSVKNRIEVLVATGFLEHDWKVSIDGKVFRVVGNETGKIR